MMKFVALIGAAMAIGGTAMGQTGAGQHQEVLLITTQKGEIVGEIHGNGDVILAKDAPVQPRVVETVHPNTQVQLGMPGALKLILGRYR